MTIQTELSFCYECGEPLELEDPSDIHDRCKPRDICERKHGGNPQSKQAFEKIKDRISKRQLEIWCLVKTFGGGGVTVDELSRILGTTPNAISGRITELRIKGKIRKDGVRKTRSGCNAAIWKAI